MRQQGVWGCRAFFLPVNVCIAYIFRCNTQGPNTALFGEMKHCVGLQDDLGVIALHDTVVESMISAFHDREKSRIDTSLDFAPYSSIVVI